MTPFEQALSLYAQHPEMNLGDDIGLHLASGGYILGTPDCFGMIRPIRKDWDAAKIDDISQVEPLETANCWFVWLLCGSMKEAVKHLPCVLPWIGFAQRGGPARFIEAEKVLAKIG